MLPYPSGEIHMGHVKNYTMGDVVAHHRRRMGMAVFHPMGYDSFGLPAENAAIRTGVPPAEGTARNIARIRQQLKALGFAIDWDTEIATSDPEYYRWTQWLFLRMYERGLAERRDVVSGKANFAEHFDVVFAEEWGRAAQLPRRRHHAEGRARDLDAAHRGVLDLDPETAAAVVLVLREILGGEYRHDEDLDRLGFVEGLALRLIGEPRQQHPVETLDQLLIVPGVLGPLVALEFRRIAEQRLRVLPPRPVAPELDEAVLAGVGAGEEEARLLRPLREQARELVGHDRLDTPVGAGGDRLVEGEVDVLADAVAALCEQARHGGDGGGGAGLEERGGAALLQRLAPGQADRVHLAAHAVEDRLRALPVAIGAVLAEVRAREHDEVRLLGSEIVKAEAKRGEVAGLE